MNIDFIDDEYRFNARSCAIIYNKDKIVLWAPRAMSDAY